MSTKEQRREQDLSNGVPVPVTDIAEAIVTRDALIVRSWWRDLATEALTAVAVRS